MCCKQYKYNYAIILTFGKLLAICNGMDTIMMQGSNKQSAWANDLRQQCHAEIAKQISYQASLAMSSLTYDQVKIIGSALNKITLEVNHE